MHVYDFEQVVEKTGKIYRNKYNTKQANTGFFFL